MRKVAYPTTISKLDAYKFESGKRGLTKQILAMNLDVLVVDKDGNAYKKDNWADSNAFWQRDQISLLVADKQTNRYASGDISLKRHLSESAWGDQANPILTAYEQVCNAQ